MDVVPLRYQGCRTSILVNVDKSIGPNAMVPSDEKSDRLRMNRFDVEFVESDPDRAVCTSICTFGFGTNDSDLISAHCCVEVPLALDRPVFFSMVDANSEGSQVHRYAKLFFCFTERGFVDCFARLHSATRYDPVASTVPLPLYEG